MRDLATVAQRYNPQPIQDKYDSTPESNHGRNVASQQKWNGYIQTAFTQKRQPEVKATDGATYKTTLLDVLKAAGKI